MVPIHLQFQAGFWARTLTLSPLPALFLLWIGREAPTGVGIGWDEYGMDPFLEDLAAAQTPSERFAMCVVTAWSTIA